MTDPSYASLLAAAESGPRLVAVTRDGDVATVVLDDPARLNPLSLGLTTQLLRALQGLVADPAIRTVILAGAGGNFSAGGDLRGMRDHVHALVDEGDEGAVAMWRWIRSHFGAIVRTITQSDKVFIAAVRGAAAGVALAFALACDLLILADDARLVLAFGKIGLLPEVGTSWLLTRRLGYAKTFELYLGGQPLDARAAERLGLVNEVVPAGDELARARAWADRVRAAPAAAVTMTKPLLRAAADMGWHQALALEEFAEPMCFTTAAHRDAVRAMLSRRG